MEAATMVFCAVFAMFMVGLVMCCGFSALNALYGFILRRWLEFRKAKIHDVKIWTKFLPDVKSGKKSFEVRYDDRNYQVGDYILQRGWNPEKFTGEKVLQKITYKLNGGQFGVEHGFCVLGVKNLHSNF